MELRKATSPRPLDDDVPAPAHADPLAVFARLAAERSLFKPGDRLDWNLVDLCFDVVEACAKVGDGYSDPEAGGNAGEHIRCELGDMLACAPHSAGPGQPCRPNEVPTAGVRAKRSQRIVAPVGQIWESFFLDGLAVTRDFIAVRPCQHQRKRETL